MERQALKDFIYGGICELMHSSKYYHYSPIGRDYSKWTPEGREALTDLLAEMSKFVYEVELKELDTRAKNLVLKNLKS